MKSTRIRLRKLAPLSQLHFGQHKGRSIIQILSLGDVGYLLWAYYNKKDISFNDEVFEDYVPIPPEYRIEKPGTNPKLFKDKKSDIMSAVFSAKEHDQGAISARKMNIKHRKDNRRRFRNTKASKLRDARRNHGHRLN